MIFLSSYKSPLFYISQAQRLLRSLIYMVSTGRECLDTLFYIHRKDMPFCDWTNLFLTCL